MSIRRDSSFLKDVQDAAGKIESTIAATSENSFLADEVSQAAVLHHLTVIGEAINRLSPEVRNNHPEVPWRQIVSVRNRIVHAYFDWIGKSYGSLRPRMFQLYAFRSRRSCRATSLISGHPEAAARAPYRFNANVSPSPMARVSLSCTASSITVPCHSTLSKAARPPGRSSFRTRS